MLSIYNDSARKLWKRKEQRNGLLVPSWYLLVQLCLWMIQTCFTGVHILYTDWESFLIYVDKNYSWQKILHKLSSFQQKQGTTQFHSPSTLLFFHYDIQMAIYKYTKNDISWKLKTASFFPPFTMLHRALYRSPFSFFLLQVFVAKEW